MQRATHPGRPDMEMTRANETTIGAVAVFVGVRQANWCQRSR